MRACFCATVSPGLFLALRFGVRVGVPAFVGTVVWFWRGEDAEPEARVACRVGAICDCGFGFMRCRGVEGSRGLGISGWFVERRVEV